MAAGSSRLCLQNENRAAPRPSCSLCQPHLSFFGWGIYAAEEEEALVFFLPRTLKYVKLARHKWDRHGQTIEVKRGAPVADRSWRLHTQQSDRCGGGQRSVQEQRFMVSIWGLQWSMLYIVNDACSQVRLICVLVLVVH